MQSAAPLPSPVPFRSPAVDVLRPEYPPPLKLTRPQDPIADVPPLVLAASATEGHDAI